MYGKINDDILQIAPNKLTVEDNQIWNASSDVYIANGWKPVSFTQRPDPEPGFDYVGGWKETAKKITQTWTKVEAPDIVSDSEALAELLEVIG